VILVGAWNLHQALVTVVGYAGAHAGQRGAVEAPPSLLNIHPLRSGVESLHPSSGDLLTLLAWITVEVIDFMNASRDEPGRKPLKGRGPGSVQRAFELTARSLLEPDILMPPPVFPGEIEAVTLWASAERRGFGVRLT
jgi:hypothetical protein